MRKHILIAGMLIAAALVFALPSKADTVNFSLSGGAIVASFTLPDTFTPGFTFGSIQYVFDVEHSTLFANHDYTFATIDLGNTGSGLWSFGSTGHTMNGMVFPGPELGVFVAGLFNMNADGTITVNAGQWTLLNNVGSPVTLTTTVIPGPVGTPEPATLALLGIGGLVLAGIRRRKTA
jgi:hypothetical protein